MLKKIALPHTLFAITALFLFCQTSGFASNTDNNSNRIFIVDCETNEDYSLHSYYLYLHQPVFKAHSTALQHTEILLRQISKIKRLNANTPLAKQQTIYIPVSFEPQSWVVDPEEDDFEAASRWIMQNYDYQCAKALLEPFPQLTDNGPYILSSTKKIQPQKLLPKSANTTMPLHNPLRAPVLTQNLSNIEPGKYLYWVKTFFKKSWQQQQWKTVSLFNLHENMLENLFIHETQLKEENAPQPNIPQLSQSQTSEPNSTPFQTTLSQHDSPKHTRLLSEEDIPPSFIALDNPDETVTSLNNAVENIPSPQEIVQIDPSKNYPVNALNDSPANPYIDLITLEYSKVKLKNDFK